MECEAEDCEADATVELHVPWDANRTVCAAHARTMAREDGIVPAPIEGEEDAWPEGDT